jgi:hypothetical protein
MESKFFENSKKTYLKTSKFKNENEFGGSYCAVRLMRNENLNKLFEINFHFFGF